MAEGKGLELLVAARKGDLDAVHTLIRGGVKVGTHDENGASALHHAAKSGNLAVVQYLCRRGANINRTTTYFGHTALHWAATEGHLEIVRYLVKHILLEQGSIDVQDKQGDTALILAVKNEHLFVVRYLLEKGADQSIAGSEGRTAVQWAAKKRYADMVEYLVSEGGDVEAKPSNHKSVAEVAKKVPKIHDAVIRGLNMYKAKQEMLKHNPTHHQRRDSSQMHLVPSPPPSPGREERRGQAQADENRATQPTERSIADVIDDGKTPA